MMKQFLTFCMLICGTHGRPQEPDAPNECSGSDKFVHFEDCLAQGTLDPTDLRIGLPEEEGVCCPLEFIIGDQVSSGNTSACSENPGFSCTAATQCINREIITNDGQRVLKAENVKSDELDIRQLTIDPSNSKCQGDLEVCCKDEEEGSPKPKIPDDDDGTFTHKCGRHNENGIHIRQTESLEGKLTTLFGEWPHSCILYWSNSSQGPGFEPRSSIISDADFIGGASLISPGFVLTAGHKVFGKDPSSLTVRCGEWDTKTETEPFKHQDRKVTEFYVHPAFHETEVHYNFALLKLETDFELSSHIDTVCLPTKPDDSSEFETAGCVATGFGKDTFEGQYQKAMKQVIIPLVENHECETRIQTKKGANFKLDDSFICAGGEPNGADTCQGDGGGPLVCPSKDSKTFIQVGIVSWGVGCGTANIPGVYTSIAKGLCFIDWVSKCKANSESNQEYYNIDGCENWPSAERSRLETIKADLETKKAGLPDSSKNVLDKQLQRVTESIEKVKDFDNSCR